MVALSVRLSIRGCVMAQCAHCGFLAAREFATNQFVEMPLMLRETGKHPPSPDNRRNIYDSRPICFVLAHRIDQEWDRDDPGVLLGVLNKERDCASFTDWQQGFTPKEHREMELAAEQRRWQQRESESQRQWQLDQETKADQRHTESLKVANAAANKAVWSALIGAAIGAGATLGAVQITKTDPQPAVPQMQALPTPPASKAAP